MTPEENAGKESLVGASRQKPSTGPSTQAVFYTATLIGYFGL